MTAYIDNITIVGTPEEIQEFIELRNLKQGGANTQDFNICMSCYSSPCNCRTVIAGNLSFIPDGQFPNNAPIPNHAYFQNDNVAFDKDEGQVK